MRIGYFTAAWGLVFAIVHAYWAAGGGAGMSGDSADTAGAQAYIGFIALLGIAGAWVAMHLALGGGGRAPVLLARAGGAALLVGVAVGGGRWLADGSLGGDGAEGVAITLYFLLGGILFSLLGWSAWRTRPTSASEVPRPRRLHRRSRLGAGERAVVRRP
jgi:hypothetical protein